MEYILEVNKLCKQYGNFWAVKDLSFKVKPGICYGLLGPNGAGKSTTIEMIEQVKKPTSGQILFRNKPTDDSFLEQLGVQFQETAITPHLSIREALTLFSRLYQNPRPLDEVISLCQLEDFQHRRHEKVSGGQKQRLLLAIALCNSPSLLLLDEPTTGLDPQARRHLWDIVKGIKKEGKTIILTTHYMDEAEELCEEIGIIDHGALIASGTPKELLRKHCQTIIIQVPIFPDHQAKLQSIAANHHIAYDDESIFIHTSQLNQTLRELMNLNLDLHGLQVRQGNLEDLFLKLTGKGLRQ